MVSFFVHLVEEIVLLFLDMAPFLILGMLITGLLSVVLTRAMIARYAGGRSWKAVIKASLFGVPLPLCSCGVLPTALYLRESGASKPAVQSFLISTPQTGFDSIIASYGMLGPLFALYRAVTALLLGIAGGMVSSVFSAPDIQPEVKAEGHDDHDTTRSGRFRKALHYGFVEFIDDIGGQFLLGLLVAGVLTVLVPDDYFASTQLGSGITGMLLMILVSIPIYMCSTSSIPIAVALMAKGVSPGAALVLLVAGPATNAATLLVLKKKLGLRETMIYLSTLVAGSLLFGLLFDFLINTFSLQGGIRFGTAADVHGLLSGWIAYPSALLLAGLLVYSFSKRLYIRIRGNQESCGEHCSCPP